MACFILISIFLCGYAVNGIEGCQPCLCIPTDNAPFLVLCQGRHISSFPDLDTEARKYVESVHLFDTFIQYLQHGQDIAFPKLTYFEEGANPLLSCTDVSIWREQHPNAVFVTDCELDMITRDKQTTLDSDTYFPTEPTSFINETSIEREGQFSLEWYWAIMLIVMVSSLPLLIIIPLIHVKACYVCERYRLCKKYGEVLLCKRCAVFHQARVITEFQRQAPSNWCPCVRENCQMCRLFTNIITSDENTDFSIAGAEDDSTYAEINCVENVLYQQDPASHVTPTPNTRNPFDPVIEPGPAWPGLELFELSDLGSEGVSIKSAESQVSVQANVGSDDERGEGL